MAEQLELKKRTECFAIKPAEWGIICDICGGDNLHWSEWEGLIWCYDCEKDTKGTGGIFDGPIPMGAAELFGFCFDKIHIESGKIMEMVRDGGHCEWVFKK
ncbi:hypothetical protein KAR91_78970 [Candidatus Pacearchaeota archaeon]|nr:hypothetical protein [Candidatus Pacearchaeota archaeon]